MRGNICFDFFFSLCNHNIYILIVTYGGPHVSRQKPNSHGKTKKLRQNKKPQQSKNYDKNKKPRQNEKATAKQKSHGKIKKPWRHKKATAKQNNKKHGETKKVTAKLKKPRRKKET